jgi:dolichol-phosphate mannosyltransferase
MNIKISVVSPVYRAEKIVPNLVQRIKNALEKITSDYEIILVEDCGPDNSWAAIEKECSNNKKVKGIKLSRNFGQHYAITAGLDHCTGDWIVVMDCDLQDQPEEIEKMLDHALNNNYDYVFGQRINRKDSFLKKTSSLLFVKFFSWLTGTQQDASIANFGVFSKKVIDAFVQMREPQRTFPAMVRWTGFSMGKIPIKHDARSEGKSSYTFAKLVSLAIDSVLSYSDRPLYITIQIGMIISLLSIFIAFYNLTAYFIGLILVPGYTSTIFAIFFMGGLILFFLGVIGLYISKIFDGVKQRPLYIIQRKIN